jgi:hypothetical protein
LWSAIELLEKETGGRKEFTICGAPVGVKSRMTPGHKEPEVVTTQRDGENTYDTAERHNEAVEARQEKVFREFTGDVIKYYSNAIRRDRDGIPHRGKLDEAKYPGGFPHGRFRDIARHS